MPVTKDEVRSLYRVILGREPESEEAVLGLSKSKDFHTLRESFLCSPEFIRTSGGSAARKKSIVGVLPLDAARNAIEHISSPAQLGDCLAKIKLAWSHLGVVRPYFSVLTDRQFLPENLDRNIDKFWASGEAEAVQVENMLSNCGFTDGSTKICLEYGCGVGRVTTAFARRFARIHAYDISQAHLTQALQRARDVGANNIQFHLCADRFLDELTPCDFFYSRIVFQHNPPPIIHHLIKRALRSLKPNGIAIFQVPTYRMGYSFEIDAWVAADHALDMQMHCLPQDVIFSEIGAEKCDLLSVREDNSTGDPGRFISNTFVVRKRTLARDRSVGETASA
jgi:SAM-dependent methyltransferase